MRTPWLTIIYLLFCGHAFSADFTLIPVPPVTSKFTQVRCSTVTLVRPSALDPDSRFYLLLDSDGKPFHYLNAHLTSKDELAAEIYPWPKISSYAMEQVARALFATTNVRSVVFQYQGNGIYVFEGAEHIAGTTNVRVDRAALKTE
jgi:hypothetical protein